MGESSGGESLRAGGDDELRKRAAVMRKGVVLAGAALLLVCLVVVFFRWQSAREARDTYRRLADSLQVAVDSLDVEYARVKAELPPFESDDERNFWYWMRSRPKPINGCFFGIGISLT